MVALPVSALVWGALTPAQAAEPVPVPVPGTIAEPRSDVTYQFSLPEGYYTFSGGYGFWTYFKLQDAQGTEQAPIWEGNPCKVYKLPAGTYTGGAEWAALGPRTESADITITPETALHSTQVPDLAPRDLQIEEKEGGLLVKWTPPPTLVGCPEGASRPAEARVYRDGFVVQTVSARTDKGAIFIDPLTVGVRYGVRLVSDYMLPTTLVGHGTPRIPSVLLFDAPRQVEAEDPFPIDVELEDRKGRPLPNELVTLYYEPPKAANMLRASKAPKLKRLKTVKTARDGHARTKIKLKRSGRIVAQYKARGKHGAAQKRVKVRVRR